MAANKEKLLESAQKSLRKKQIAKAIKDFSKVVELDPADVRSRQKLAELLVRSNRNAEAYEHFESVAKYFSSNGFYLKAIAIYKQMQRLDPSQIALFSRLAELNEKQGLIGNAMAEYRNLMAYYERNGMTADVINILEKMRDLDTSNLNVRVKLAEVYAQNDREEEGLAEFDDVLVALTEKNDYDKILRLYKMFMPLFPTNRKLKMGLALTLYEKGELEKGVAIFASLLQEKPNDPDLLRLIARGYADLKDWPNACQSYQQLLELDPTDLETRELYIQSLLDSGQYEQGLAELEEWKDSFFKADRLDQLKLHYELLKEHLEENASVLQTLDSIYELTGEGDKLLDIISEREEEADESTGEETLSDSILASAEEDIELQLIDDDEEAADEETDELIFEAPEEDHDLELDLLSETDEDASLETTSESDSVIELDLKDDDAQEQVVDELELSFDLAEEEEASTGSTTQRDLKTELVEADFYIQQGLYAEAEKLCQDLLVAFPDSADCQQKLDEVLALIHAEQEEPVEQTDLDVQFQLDEAGDETEQADADGDFFSALEEEGDEQKIFRTDVDEQIAADDMESHYNLGIAYREMGLYEDAISEFEKAEKDPSRFVDCQSLKGLCFADKGDYASAELMYQQALDSQHLEEEQRLSLSYELAALYESMERFEEALGSYRAVKNQDEDYRDVKDKIMALQESLGIVVESEENRKERISFL